MRSDPHPLHSFYGRSAEGPASRVRSELQPGIGGAQSGKILIALEGLTKSYEVGDATVTALNSVDLNVYEGEFVVVLGPFNASGSATVSLTVTTD